MTVVAQIQSTRVYQPRLTFLGWFPLAARARGARIRGRRSAGSASEQLADWCLNGHDFQVCNSLNIKDMIQRIMKERLNWIGFQTHGWKILRICEFQFHLWQRNLKRRKNNEAKQLLQCHLSYTCLNILSLHFLQSILLTCLVIDV